jgi:hypothetical protein
MASELVLGTGSAVKAEQDRELAKLERQAHIMDGVYRHHASMDAHLSLNEKQSA